MRPRELLEAPPNRVLQTILELLETTPAPGMMAALRHSDAAVLQHVASNDPVVSYYLGEWFRLRSRHAAVALREDFRAITRAVAAAVERTDAPLDIAPLLRDFEEMIGLASSWTLEGRAEEEIDDEFLELAASLRSAGRLDETKIDAAATGSVFYRATERGLSPEEQDAIRSTSPLDAQVPRAEFELQYPPYHGAWWARSTAVEVPALLGAGSGILYCHQPAAPRKDVCSLLEVPGIGDVQGRVLDGGAAGRGYVTKPWHPSVHDPQVTPPRLEPVPVGDSTATYTAHLTTRGRPRVAAALTALRPALVEAIEKERPRLEEGLRNRLGQWVRERVPLGSFALGAVAAAAGYAVNPAAAVAAWAVGVATSHLVQSAAARL